MEASLDPPLSDDNPVVPILVFSWEIGRCNNKKNPFFRLTMFDLCLTCAGHRGKVSHTTQNAVYSQFAKVFYLCIAIKWT